MIFSLHRLLFDRVLGKHNQFYNPRENVLSNYHGVDLINWYQFSTGYRLGLKGFIMTLKADNYASCYSWYISIIVITITIFVTSLSSLSPPSPSSSLHHHHCHQHHHPRHFVITLSSHHHHHIIITNIITVIIIIIIIIFTIIDIILIPFTIIILRRPRWKKRRINKIWIYLFYLFF